MYEWESHLFYGLQVPVNLYELHHPHPLHGDGYGTHLTGSGEGPDSVALSPVPGRMVKLSVYFYGLQMSPWHVCFRHLLDPADSSIIFLFSPCFTITFLKEVFNTFCLFLLTHQPMAMWLPVPLLLWKISQGPPALLCPWFLNLQLGSKKLSWVQSLIPLSTGHEPVLGPQCPFSISAHQRLFQTSIWSSKATFL